MIVYRNLFLMGSTIDTVGLGRGNSNHWIGIFTPEGCLLNSCGTEILHTQTEHAEMPGTDIKVYPNPFTNEINIKTEDELSFSEWKIYDMSGRVLKQGMFSGYTNIESINASELNSGNYLLQLQGEQGVVSKTIIKK